MSFSIAADITSPAVYVGTYHKYNCGSIAGAWIDITEYDNSEDFYQKCRELHADEVDPELMFQDWEGFPEGMASECSINWDFVESLKEACENNQEAAFLAFVDLFNNCDYNTFSDAYRGVAKNEEAYARELVEDSGMLKDVPDSLARYFDYEAYARDLFMDGYTLHDSHVFDLR